MTISNLPSSSDGEQSRRMAFCLEHWVDPEPERGPSSWASPPVPLSTSHWLVQCLLLWGAFARVIFLGGMVSFALLASIADLGSYLSIRLGNLPMTRFYARLFPYHPELRIRSTIHEQDPSRPSVPTP